jgi:TolB-like protein
MARPRVRIAPRRHTKPREQAKIGAAFLRIARGQSLRLLAELKRRNVFRMAGLYLVGAWLVVQVAETLLPIFHTPDWVLQALVVLLALGLVPALVFSWLYELTPDGLRREGEVDPAQAMPSQTARRMDLLTLAGVAVLLVVTAADRWWPGTVSPAVAPAPDVNVSNSSAPAPEAASDSTHSIAVLPFVNLSPDPANAYFADGISEELLNILVGVDGLKVASRASSFSFRGKDTPLPEIARQLGVRHVLDGSVRKQDNRVRITAQLIEADSDTQLWSQTFERDLVDIFRVQEEIARAITTSLENVLGVRKVSVAAPTADLEAYERFLRGRTRFYQRSGLDEANADLAFAVERDPAFAEAWAFLAAASFVVGNGGYPTELDRQALMARALSSAERALALNPEIGIALAVRGQMLVNSGDDAEVAEGIRLLEQAADRISADTSPRLWAGLAWLSVGFVERALPHFQSAQDQDPLVGINNGYLGLAYATQGRWEAGGRLAHRAIELSGLPFWTNNIAVGLANAGREKEAWQLLHAAQPMLAGVPQLGGDFLEGLLAALEDPALRAAFLAANEYDPERDNGAAALVAALMFGDADRAFRADGPPGTRLILTACAWLPSMGWLREHPRFYQRMEARGVVRFWDEQGYPGGCRPVEDPAGRRLDCSGYAP